MTIGNAYWYQILSSLNSKRIEVGKSIISKDFSGRMNQSYINALRNGIIEILIDYGFTGLEDALNKAGYNYSTWMTWEENYIADRSLNEIINILNLMTTTLVTSSSNMISYYIGVRIYGGVVQSPVLITDSLFFPGFIYYDERLAIWTHNNIVINMSGIISYSPNIQLGIKLNKISDSFSGITLWEGWESEEQIIAFLQPKLPEAGITGASSVINISTTTKNGFYFNPSYNEVNNYAGHYIS